MVVDDVRRAVDALERARLGLLSKDENRAHRAYGDVCLALDRLQDVIVALHVNKEG